MAANYPAILDLKADAAVVISQVRHATQELLDNTAVGRTLRGSPEAGNATFVAAIVAQFRRLLSEQFIICILLIL